MYLNAKTDESIVHEWIDFPELESVLQEKIVKEDKHTSLHVRFIFKFKLNTK